MAYKWSVAVTIPGGDVTGLSGVYDFGGGASRVGVVMPATWTTAAISFQVAATAGGTYYDLYNEAGAEVHMHPAQQKSFSLDSQAPYLAPFRWVKVRSGQTGAAVEQGTTSADARILTFYFQR